MLKTAKSHAPLFFICAILLFISVMFLFPCRSVAESIPPKSVRVEDILTTGGQGKKYTRDSDFDQGAMVNLNHNLPNNNRLQLNEHLTTFPFIWIALSGKGTIAKIHTETGKIVGEYISSPQGRGRNPSRTTVDLKGNVWVGNRGESQGGVGSAVHIGCLENSQCIDRNQNGRIDTSTGLGDVKPWPNTGGQDNNGGVSTAEDECIIHYVRGGNAATRHLTVDKNNNIWIGGYSGQRRFVLADGNTGEIIQRAEPFECGGYGGLIDGNGVVWSADFGASRLLRFDPATRQAECLRISHSYGLGIDRQGNIWNAQYSNNTITKIAPDGAVLKQIRSAQRLPRGLAVSSFDDHVWVANSGSDTVTRYDNDGNELAVIPLAANRKERRPADNVQIILGNILKSVGLSQQGGSHPTGVAIDAAGKVWVANFRSDNAMRINPNTNKVDMIVHLGKGARPYNYSDMTGSVALGKTSPQGTWTVIYDSSQSKNAWGTVHWDSIDNGGTVNVQARSAEYEAALGQHLYIELSNDGKSKTVPNGRYLQIEVKLTPSPNGKSPILNEISIGAQGQGILLADHRNTCVEINHFTPTASPKTISVKLPLLVAVLLAEVGYYAKSVDEDIDLVDLETALMVFQKDIGISMTGRINEATWNKLKNLKFGSEKMNRLKTLRCQ